MNKKHFVIGCWWIPFVNIAQEELTKKKGADSKEVIRKRGTGNIKALSNFGHLTGMHLSLCCCIKKAFGLCLCYRALIMAAYDTA